MSIMQNKDFQFPYAVFSSVADLPQEDRQLFEEAIKKMHHSYAPYSHFHVVATIRMENEALIVGNNQENAAYAVCICAERVALATASSVHPQKKITAIAISYQDSASKSSEIISPCGVCRQAMLEVEQQQQTPIKVLFGGFQGKIVVVPSAHFLLPFAFDKSLLS